MRAICPMIMLVVLLCPWCADAQQDDFITAAPVRSDRTALGTIFADRHADVAALDIHRRALRMAVEDRFEFLSRWVLPNEDHSTFRLQAGFSPTHPAPPTAEVMKEQGRRVQSGGEIVSPALDLIDAASSLNKLHELRQRVEAAPLFSTQSRVDRPAMLALIEMALGDLESACAHLQEALEAALPDANDIEVGRVSRLPDAVLLAVDKAAEAAEAANVAISPAYQVTLSYRSIYVRTAWQRHFTAAYNRVKQTLQSDGPLQTVTDAKDDSSRWIPISILRARHRGTGAPVARWEWGDGTADNLWSHDEDYLLFRIPLRGSFAVEGDVRAFGWEETQMLVAGKWLGPYRGRRSYLVGTVGSPQSIIRVEPPILGKMGNHFHYRTAVRDLVATTWFNGRLVHREPLTSEHEPWIAVRSSPRHDGDVRDLRITGDPQVPEALLLSGSPELAGWNIYFNESDDLFAGLPIDVNGRQWQFRSASNQAGEIIGQRRTELPQGCHQESLLTYFRPMLEDGSIEYEFWYEPGEFHASPALDRLCFLLDPGGVKIHWLTDGRFDQTNLHPDNTVMEPANRRGPEQLPLKTGAWNRLRLTLEGDTVDLELNDELVYQRTLEATNQRVFGFFHYADRTGLRVRNVVWKGDWTKELPPLDAQVLASHETQDIDKRLPQLKAVFSHDFVADGLPPSRFSILQGDIPEHVEAKNDGVHARRPGTGGYQNTTIAPKLKVGGDFDITVAFDQFAADPEPAGKCSIMLLTIADNESEDEATLLRRRIREQPEEHKIVQCIRVSRMPSGVRRNYFASQTVEANAGRFRMARRSDRLYYLFAENDSDQFRVIGESSYPTDDLQLEGVRLVMQTYGQTGSTSVVWKSLTVRAEEIGGLATEDISALLTELNQQRNELPASFTHDFTRQPPDETLFNRGTDEGAWKPGDPGLRIVAPGTDNWTSVGSTLLKKIEGDFDISIRATLTRFDRPAESKNSGAYLQVELANDDRTQASILLFKTADGRTEVLAQLRVPNGRGGYDYPRVGGRAAQSVDGLRLARRGKRIYFLATSKDFGGERVVAFVDVDDAPIRIGGTQVLVHTGGAGRESHLIWKEINVKADRINPD